jgi:hypothetical protein
MIQGRECLAFALETGQPLWISCKCVGQYFDRHLPTEIGIRCAVHLAHPACANRGVDFVRTETNASCQRHSEVAGL